jgi:hypothetical protein
MTLDEWTQESVWYNSLPVFERRGLKLPTRKYFKGLIRKVCRNLGVTREKIGIVAAPWATMYYKGNWTSVSFDALNALAENGTDIIFIEKLDIVRVEGKNADKYGIALVNSRGNLSEYAEDLADKAKASGAHVGISADYDIPGILIISKLKGVFWLGVNEEMLQHFGISKENMRLVVPYNPKRDRITKENFIKLVNEDPRFRTVDTGFLEKQKIELDAVLAEVGSERLFEYYMEILKKIYPKRDYTRVIEPRPSLEDHYPKAIRNFTKYIASHAEDITEQESDKIEKEELKDVEGFIDVPEKEKDIDKRLGDIVDADQHLKDIASALENLATQKGYDLNQFDIQEKHHGEKDQKGKQND